MIRNNFSLMNMVIATQLNMKKIWRRNYECPMCNNGDKDRFTSECNTVIPRFSVTFGRRNNAQYIREMVNWGKVNID